VAVVLRQNRIQELQRTAEAGPPWPFA